jgi:isohexenylglutaconyl-CoA hydratase
MVNTTPQVVVPRSRLSPSPAASVCLRLRVAICTEDAGFAMSETAIGIVPAQIAPSSPPASACRRRATSP